MDTAPIVNKVAESGLITLDPADFAPKQSVLSFDLKDYLFMGLILKEKDFRAALQQINWSNYDGSVVAVFCSADAIIPMWAYMLVATYLTPVAQKVFFGTPEQAFEQAWLQNIQALPVADFTDKRMVIKGCGDLPVSAAVYLTLTNLLQPVAKSIMYGEPCSTVPVYKKK
jgi:hypothetical protein